MVNGPERNKSSTRCKSSKYFLGLRKSIVIMGYLIPLAVSVFITMALMITAHGLPRWYSTSVSIPDVGVINSQIGLWRSCSSVFNGTSRVCVDYLAVGSIADLDAALRSAEAFAIIAVILVGIGTLTTFLIEVVDTRSHGGLLHTPRIIFVMSALAMAIAAFSFMALVLKTSTPGRSGKYDDSFLIAWGSVGASLASATFAHLHHSRKSTQAGTSYLIPLEV